MKIGSTACWRRATVGSPFSIGAHSWRPVSTSPEIQMAQRAIAGSVAKLPLALNLTCSNRLWHQVRLVVEPPCLLSLRSLVGQFYPCN